MPVATLTIASSGSTSDAFDARAATAVGLLMPAAFTGTAITFTVSDTLAGTYVPLNDRLAVAVSVTVAASQAYDLPGELTAWSFIKLVSNGVEASARSLKLVWKGRGD